MPMRHAVLSLTVLLTLPCLHAANDAHFLQPAVRIRYERTQDGALITGHGTAFGVDLSAFGVRGKKYLLSAAHNVLDDKGNAYTTLKIEINEGLRTYWSRCKVVAADPGMDLCLVEAGDDVPALAALADFDAAIGTPIVLAGSPRGIPISLFKGSLTRRFENGTVRSMAEVPFDHGDSGGPIYCGETGKVIGVAVAGIPKNGDLDHTVGLFVPTIGIANFLETHCAAKLKFKRMPTVSAVPKTNAASESPSTPAKSVESAAVKPLPHTEEIRASVSPALAATIQKPLTAPIYVAPGAAPAVTPTASAVVTTPAPATPAAAVVQTTSLAQIIELEPLKRPPPITYVVQEGDSLGRIARKHNTTVKALLAINSVRDPNRITVGMVLVLP